METDITPKSNNHSIIRRCEYLCGGVTNFPQQIIAVQRSIKDFNIIKTAITVYLQLHVAEAQVYTIARVHYYFPDTLGIVGVILRVGWAGKCSTGVEEDATTI